MAVAALQVAGQVFQVGKAAAVGTLFQGGASPQQLMDRLFLAMARYTTVEDAQDNLWDGANVRTDWLAIPAQSSAATGDIDAVSDRIAVNDQVFARFTDKTEDFMGDL
jgi:hypothetical protein